MPKPIPQFCDLFIALGLSACAAWQTPGGLTEAPAAEQAATVPAPYVDYWQTRDPSEYRRDAVAVRQPGAQSGDAVIQGKQPECWNRHCRPPTRRRISGCRHPGKKTGERRNG